HRAVSRLLPGVEEFLEHVVDERALTPRIHHLLILGLLFQFENVLCEELERAVEIGLDRADRPRAGRDAAYRAVELGCVGRRPLRPHLRPTPGVALEWAEGRRL